MQRVKSEVRLLLDALDEAFDRRSWHGTNLRGSLRGVTAGQAAWRPAPGRHNIEEIAVHAAYWKYVVRRVITGGKRGSFPLRGSNWFAREGEDAIVWRRDLQLLAGQHHELCEAVAALPAIRLHLPSGKRGFTYAGLIRGVAAHDLYHAGQIQLLKRLRVTAT